MLVDILKYPHIIVFDLDNTLIQSQIDFEGIRVELKRRVEKYGLSNSSQFLDLPISRILSIIKEKFGPKSDKYKEAWQIVENFELQGMKQSTIEPEVLPTLVKIRDLGIKTAILTNNSRNATLKVLNNFDLNVFDLIVSRDDIIEMKPSGLGLSHIINEFSGSVSKTIFIGDSYIDALCAQEVGVKFIVIGSKNFPGIVQRDIPYFKKLKSIKQILSLFESNLLFQA